MEHLIGLALGRYKIISLLGEGGMGAVYKARDETLKRDVALKVMNPQFGRLPNFQERFLQEARTVARLSHPNVVQVFDFGQQVVDEVQQLFIVMEFIPGQNLSQALKDYQAKSQPFPQSEALELVRQVALALEYAHRQGVLHRDLKPDNVILRSGISVDSPESLPYRPVITDLGLAKLTGGDVETQVGTTMGTPAYMSPEQAMGQQATAGSDIYSLGVMLYELCAGRLPFQVKNLMEAVKAHTQTPPPPPRSINADLPVPVEALILKMLEKDPSRRYSDAASLARAVEQVQQELKPPPPPPPPPPTAKPGPPVDPRATQFEAAAGLGADNRGQSVMQDFGAASASSEEQVQVLFPSGKTVTYRIRSNKPLTIGRDASNDIVLEDAQASRNHARIDYDGKNFKVTDLKSRNGTFLETAKLLPGIAEAWPVEKAVRIGGCYLRVVRGQEVGKTAVVSRDQVGIPAGGGHVRSAEPVARGQVDDRVDITLEKDQLTVEPGNLITVTLTIFNHGSLVDHFITSVEGIPPEWIPTQPPPVQLMPGAQHLLTFAINPPRSPKSKAGSYPIKVRVRSRDATNRAAEANATLKMMPYSQFTSTLFPQKVKSGRASRLKVENLGNAEERFNIIWQDRAVELDFRPPQAQITVAPGQESFAEFKAFPRQRPFLGGEKLHPFQAEVSPFSGGLPQQLNGEVISRARIPTWIIPLLLLLCLCLLAAAGFYGVQYYNAQQTQQATADNDQDKLINAEETALGTRPDNPDTDGDGLSDYDEVKIHGTDPLKKDTDGDTLLDGDEVNNIGTSPSNQDTDGDGIKDNIDPSPLNLPTVTPTPTVTPKPTEPPQQLCPNTYPSFLRVGMTAVISPSEESNRIREAPGLSSTDTLKRLRPGEKLVILGGPECKDNMVWWNVRSLSDPEKLGWTSEGGNGEYWVQPAPSP